MEKRLIDRDSLFCAFSLNIMTFYMNLEDEESWE